MEAYAPGSVTAVFAPAESGNESRGASVAIEDGVVASVASADRRVVTLDGDETSFEPVELLLEDLDVTARVDLTAQVPVGCGFGASGAATLATALAVDERFGLGHTREELVEAAHRAEVAAGTGLGDVFIQSMGGLVTSYGDGIERHDRDDRVEYVSFGGMATSDALGDADLMADVERVGGAVLDDLPTDPSLPSLTARAWEFAREIGLPTDRVRDAVTEVEAAGGAASMAMLGETVFAVGVEGVLDERTRVASEGARLR
ncbi:GHMP kinase [Halomicrococcus sp. NG-SE-24]|uniref:GHMP family kinase ATP-binding protein n=1 Tax=Halomicrococcus sp. NG-SE-24 TaxID=3436928 RepID=UPI003D95C682